MVPNNGWMHAQLQDIQTRAPNGTIHTNDTLLTELRRNIPFKNTIFCLVPHWQGSAYTVTHSERTTVTMAFVDEKGAVSSSAIAAGTYMFNSCARLIITGDLPTIVMCGRCHRIRHTTRAPACPLLAGTFQCIQCGGSHHTDDHNKQCNGCHLKAGVCNCFFQCLNCNGNHSTRSVACPLKKGFTPPDLVPHDNPTIVSILPKPSAKGKGKVPVAPPPEDLVPTQREPTLGLASASDRTLDGFIMVTKKKKGGHRGLPARPLLEGSAPPRPGTITAQINPRPEPPSVATAPVIGEPHVATMDKMVKAIACITTSSTDTTRDDNLHIICDDWKRVVEEDDPFGTLVSCIPFCYAVKYGLPLTAHTTTATITKGNLWNPQ
ncbi:hypothetical protein EDB92DRAFT_1821240 [Lactarius akahatsu]|uniref:Uncharacterized protein n=1 Tax=Lactarius akahatsu TaxID=416441 RepID=A0AAD4L6Q2_9AGAM|nr:hypothetical protein EDB92DRAFT_1821240 [Lactarius akahatsu]